MTHSLNKNLSKLRFLPTRVHAVLDYLVGLMLSLSPFITGTHHDGVIVWAPMVLGHSLILYSMATDYELGLLRLIPLKLHLIFDGISGLILLGIARLYAPSTNMMVPLLVIALVEIASSLATKVVTSDGPGLETALDFSWRWNTGAGAMPLAAGSKTVDGRPDYALQPGVEHNNEQLRRAIDSGKAGDKTAMTDPAAAPLGSDDEAAELHDERGLATARRAVRIEANRVNNNIGIRQ